MLKMQKAEANNEFGKFIRNNYLDWVRLDQKGLMVGLDQRPLMSPDIFKRKIFPLLDQGEKVFLID